MGDLAGAIDGTPSKIEEVDDNTTLAHVLKQLQVAHDEDGFPSGGPKRITWPSCEIHARRHHGSAWNEVLHRPKNLMKAVWNPGPADDAFSKC